MKRRLMRTRSTATVVAGLLAVGLFIGVPNGGVPNGAFADGGGGGGGDERKDSATPTDPQYTEAVSAVKRGDYPTAIRLFETVVSRDQGNADAYNWLAYSIRKNGDATRAIPIYEKALAINPKHRGAHEYIGEAYLVLGNLAKAKEHLAVLDKLCFFPCEEYADLKKAVRAYEASGGRTKPTSRLTQ
jgi:tetratricopeptide (TPR) repeat protein